MRKLIPLKIQFFIGLLLWGVLNLNQVYANSSLENYSSSSDTSFITIWKTNNPGTSDSSSITIPTNPENNGYNYDIDWDNDGIFDELGVDTSITHNYGMPGTYTIRIRGSFPHIYFNGAGDKEKLIDIAQWGSIQWKTMFKAFKGCSNMNISAADAPDLSNVESLTDIFFGCTVFNSNINHWDVSNVTSFYFAFGNCPNFNQPLNNWEVGNVESMQRMFIGCTVFNQPLDQWDVSNVKSFSAMFANCKAFNQPIGNWEVSSGVYFGLMFLGASSFNQPIGDWNTANLATIKAMFHKATVFNQDISNWDVSRVTNFSSLFKNATAFNQNINDWEVSNATSMSWMFAGASSFNQPLDQWEVSNVLSMPYTFFYARNFNQDISGWDVSSVTSMQNMFKGPNMTFNQDIGNWDVSSVTGMQAMFEHNPSFDQNLGDWDVSNVTTMTRMFNQAKLSTPNYDSLLIGWNALELQDSVEFHGGYSIYCAGWAARANMINADGWMITDGGAEQDAPIALCRDTTIYLDAMGIFNLDASVIDLGSYDACTEVDLLASQILFDCNDIGVISDTLTVIDKNGNQTTCIANITVKDHPFTLHCPANITVLANASDCRAVVNWNVPQGSCTTLISSTKESGDLFPLGTTTVTYTSIDGEMLSSNCSFNVTVIHDLTVAMDSIINPACQDDPSGQAFISVNGGSPPYSYTWDPMGASSPNDIEDPTNLLVGVNRVTIVDHNGCTITDSVTLQPTALNIVNCPSDQILSANHTGCTAIATWTEPIEICSGASLLSTFSNGDVFDLGTTEVSYTATNLLGNTATCSFQITVENNLEIAQTQASNPNCFETNDGAIAIAVQGGNLPYSFDWSNDGTGDFDDPEDLNQLPAGEYTLQILDDAGCEHTQIIQLTQPDVLEIIAESVHNPSCAESQDGQISVALAGGTTPYSLDWSNDGTGDFDDLEDLSQLSAGEYTLQILDDAGCEHTQTIQLTQPEALEITTESMQNPSCAESQDGQISVALEGGTAPYVLDWSNDGMGDMDDLADLNSLTGGSYVIEIMDEAGCTKLDTFLLQEPEAIVIQALVDTSNVASHFIDLEIAGGTAPYHFDWNTDETGDFDDLEDINVSEEGNYSVTVMDNDGCTSVLEIPISFAAQQGQGRCDFQSFNIYPNPSFGIFKVEFEACETPATIDIFDVLGRNIYHIETTETVQEINMETFPGDGYFLVVKTGKESFVKPFTIVKE